MKALVTGADGFVGSHFKERLLAEGWTVVSNDILSGTDCRDQFKWDKVEYDLFVHCAAQVGGRAKIDGCPLEIAQNLAIDSDAFRWALRTRPAHFVYFSSSAAYPVEYQTGFPRMRTFSDTGDPFRLSEDDINLEYMKNPDAIYGLAKLVGEHLAEKAQADGLRVHVFRPFSGYGTDQSLDYPFPSFIRRAKDRDDPFEIWGDGTAVRDWIHVDDVVEAVLTAIDQDIQGPVNLGSGIPTTFNELAEMVMEASGYHKVRWTWPPEVKHILGAPSGVQYRCSDNSKLLSFYTPKVSLAEGIERALA